MMNWKNQEYLQNYNEKYQLYSIIFFRLLFLFSGESVDSPDTGSTAGVSEAPPAVIPSQGDLLGDLLNLDLTPPTATAPAPSTGLQLGAVDLLGGGLDSLVGLLYTAVWMSLPNGHGRVSRPFPFGIFNTNTLLLFVQVEIIKP